MIAGRIFSLILCVSLLTLVVPMAEAKGPSKVSKGVHNLSTSAPSPIPGSFINNLYKSANEDQICVFCHTPHGGSLTGPLWNRSNPTSTWTHYNSASLSTYLQSRADDRVPSDESMLCLSCHDGSISPYSMINLSNAVEATDGQVISVNGDTSATLFIVGLPGVSARTGAGPSDPFFGTGDLSDDHPISFSYASVYNEYQLGSRAGQLKDPATAVTNGVRFFNGGANGNTRVECSSCHDPHVNYVDYPQYKGFLLMSNSGSALCLACHTK